MVDEPSPVMFDHLYSLSDRGAYDEIISHIRDHDDEAVRYGAAGVLSESVDEFREEITPETRKALVTAVLTDPSDAVRANVVRTLLHIDESIVDNIITRLEMEPESTPTESPYPLVLTEWHGTRWAELRFLAAAGFERVGTHSAVEKLRSTIQEEVDLRVLRRAIEAGGEVGDETFVEPIKQHLRVEENTYQQSANDTQISRTKQAATEALVKIGTDAAYEALVTASRGTDDELKQCAISEIGKFGARKTVDLIVDELNEDASDELRQEAAEGLITTFTEADFDDGHAVREAALEQIGQDVPTDVSDEFASIVAESPRSSEQRNAAWLLGQLESDTDDTVECLFAALDGDDEYLGIIAAAALAKLDAAVVEDRLESFLESVDEGSQAHTLASSIQSNVHDSPPEA
jgi:HEAT repeat protein